ncbi:penicillin-binding protein 2 [Vibrio maritimus]|uniref:Penicillin-binding protein 2 n=1 Tax=Vibrio maritimus TaxID=990268 RepID=A0A090RWD5_9VIBR|nr:penicillin-binding protein 2 [Vibrio maritimus]
MQIAKATSVLVNRGEVLSPHLLRATIDNGDSFDHQTMSEVDSRPPITGVQERYWDIALEGMRRVNHGVKGTARRSFTNMSFQSGGKSGTAQVFSLAEDEEYNAEELAEHLKDHALFTGFAPFENPEVVVTVVLENAGGGSSNGAPVARQLFDLALAEKEGSEEE